MGNSKSWKNRVAATLLAGLTLNAPVFALSLGEISLNSQFSQPLSARIAIPTYSAAELDAFRIGLATPAVFEQNGVMMTSFMKDIQFELLKDESGRPYVAVTSKTPVQELALSLYVEASWGQGRLIRGYDLIISPPLEQFDTRSFNQLLDNTQFVNTEQAVAEDSRIRRAFVAGSEEIKYGPVRPGESLSKIAQRMRPDPNMNLHQVMMAIYKDNPEAFATDNVNSLKAGVVLYLRNVQSVLNIDPEKAKEEVLDQIDNWEHAGPSNATVPQNTEFAVDNAKAANTPASAGRTRPHLEIVSGDVDKILGSNIETLDIQTLKEQLTILVEESESLRIENIELQDAVVRLEKILAQQQQDLAALQEKQRKVSILSKDNTVYTDDLVNVPSDISFKEEQTSYLSEILGVLLVLFGLVALGVTYNVKRKQSDSPYAHLGWLDDLKTRLFKRDKTHYIG